MTADQQLSQLCKAGKHHAAPINSPERRSVIAYEQAVKTDGFLVVAHGSADEMARSKAILEASNPARVDLHENLKEQASDPGQTSLDKAISSGETASVR